MDKKIPKEIIGLILMLIILYIAIIKDKRSFNYNSSIDTCIAEPFTPGRVDFYFKVKGNRYRIFEEKKRSIVEGEKYLVKYDTTNPTTNIVLLTNPVFKKSEKVDTVTGYVKEKYNDSYLFDYFINGYKYEKRGYFNDKMNRKIKIDSFYKVIYWLKNPKRAILLIDEPVSKTTLPR